MRSPQAALDALRADPCGARLLSAFAPGDGVHLVGGAVRDLLLERPWRELDLVVEGDVDAAAARLGGEVASAHERFGTARGARRRRAPSTSCAPAPRATRAPARCPTCGPARSRTTCAAAT